MKYTLHIFCSHRALVKVCLNPKEVNLSVESCFKGVQNTESSLYKSRQI